MGIGNLPTPAPGSLSYPTNPRIASIPPTHGPASIPPTNNPASIPPTHGPASIPPTNNPATIPPTNNPISRPPSNAPASMPPTGTPASRPPGSSLGTVQRRAGTPPPAMSTPSMSMEAPPRRNTALIAILLVLDLGLAAAGATLLVKGLAKPKAAAAPAPAKAESHSEAAAPAPAPVATAPASSAPGAAPAPPPAAEPIADAKPDKKTAARAKDPKEPKQADKKSGKQTVPLDPYGNAPAPEPAADQSQDVERMASQSFGSFRSCLNDAVQGGPIRGDIKIAFSIQPDGHVARAHAVVNTTNSDVLALCLEQTIATWTFAPHSGPAASYERPFSYP